MTDDSVPVTASGRALFLDVDGTLLEIAETPGAVSVPTRLKELLAKLASREAGALALVSGRSLAQLDSLFAPYRFAAAGLHGLERRDAAGHHHAAGAEGRTDTALRHRVREHLARFVQRDPGLLLEDKGPTLAMHFRQAPHLAADVRACMQAVLDDLPGYHLQAGKCVLELKPASGSKRTAIEAFMAEPPFRGRLPVFIGDDVTDEDGFAAVNALGGDSIRVGDDAQATNARWRLAGVQQVIDWLARSLQEEVGT